ncbi:hypothetical protein JRQ81_009874 [Phrynocephalus forsythii]|uniref:Eukaryotic translation initiation factor 4 gamma 3 n=1 Tax=Phrynocephalus forsythii TaxID=171643 RepID=A0A9Q1AS39_9SAUR|nr:hypothetical protein JRQ81_009874 [Phrynocephalus forsythii]
MDWACSRSPVACGAEAFTVCFWRLFSSRWHLRNECPCFAAQKVTQVARQPGPPAPSPYSAHEISKGHPALAATPPGHASSPSLTQAPYPSGQNAAPATLVYPQAPQTMSAQPQTRSPPGRAVPAHCTDHWKRRKVLEQSPVYRSLAGRGWIKYYIFAAGPRPAHPQFFQRPQIQAPRAAMQNSSSPSIRPGAQTPTALYQANPHVMMVNHLPMPYAMPQGPPQYCLPQYRHSSPPYVGPPQQYPVQPPGPGPFYPGPGPGEFPNAYGAPFYPSQPVYPSAPIIVPAQQQQPLPPAKREKKTIRIRDPNQGGKDITEEIMSGGGSRNPTPPTVRPTSTPTPPQQLPGQVPEPSPVAYGTVESSHPAAATTTTTASTVTSDPKQEEKPKADPVLKSPSPALRPEPSGERRDQAGPRTAESTQPMDASSPEPPLPAVASSPAAAAAAAAPASPPSHSPLVTDTEDGPGFTSPKQEASPPPPSVEGSSACPLAEEGVASICRESPQTVPNDLPETARTHLTNELNGVGERGPESESLVGPDPQEAADPPSPEAESAEASLAEAEGVPSPVSAAFSPPPLRLWRLPVLPWRPLDQLWPPRQPPPPPPPPLPLCCPVLALLLFLLFLLLLLLLVVVVVLLLLSNSLGSSQPSRGIRKKKRPQQ